MYVNPFNIYLRFLLIIFNNIKPIEQVWRLVRRVSVIVQSKVGVNILISKKSR